MSALLPDIKSVPSGSEVRALTKIQKLAGLLVMLGPESAAQILRNLEPHEIEIITAEMAQFGIISQELQGELLGEFSDVAVEASTAISGGAELARSTLEKAVGAYRAGDIMNKIAPAKRASTPVMQDIADMDPRHIFNLLRQEQPQTVAFVLSFLAPDKASQVLALLPAKQADQVLERLATLAPTPVEVMEKVLEVLKSKLGVKQSRPLNQSGGVTTAADLLNAMDKTVSRTLLLAVEDRNPDLGGAIRQKMFTFEDLTSLDVPTLQRILRETDTHDLAVSLKKASDKLKSLLLSCISRRAAETVQEEIAFLGVVKAREIEAAQQRIIAVVRQLEADGELDLAELRRNAAYEMA
ncbi:MAG: flagellar motor switch protein FliG [Verrucomicrobia bacterium]|nr:flagellar motor switch protein FliG [Verrucomicrobiota bacterium]